MYVYKKNYKLHVLPVKLVTPSDHKGESTKSIRHGNSMCSPRYNKIPTKTSKVRRSEKENKYVYPHRSK